jgi:RNA polymerase sigma-70 factor, ECF subfamily
VDHEALIRRCQSGDGTAFATLYQHYARKVYQTAYLIIGNRTVAEEVMQEAFAQTFRAIGSLREPAAFSTWLYRMVVRQARRVAGREWAQHHLADVMTDEPTVVPDSQDRAVLRQVLWDAIGALPEQMRTVIVFYYYHDRSVAEIAALMEVPEGTVKSWLHRARTQLGRLIGEPAGVDGGEPHA